MRLLADKLDIKTASLYNHIKNMEELIIEVCSYALKMQNDAELKAISGLSGAPAIIALANSYRSFAKEHKELCVLIMNTAASCGDKLSGASNCITQPFIKVLESYSLSETEKCIGKEYCAQLSTDLFRRNIRAFSRVFRQIRKLSQMCYS